MTKPSTTLPLYPEQVRQLVLPEAEAPASQRHTIGLGAYAFDAHGASDIELAARMAPGHLDLRLRTATLPFAAHPPRAKAVRMSLEQMEPLRGPGVTAMHRPSFLPARSVPAASNPRERYFGKLPRSLNKRLDQVFDQPLDIPDTRYAYFDTAYPWSAFGRVTSGGYGASFAASGVMVGPRHALVSSGAVGWHGAGDTDWLVFTPCYSHGLTPFGSAYAERIYAWRQVPLIYFGKQVELKAVNYAVVILNSRIGDTTGWVGTRIYEPGWDGAAVWSMSSYNSHFWLGDEPVYQDSLTLGPVEFPPGADPSGQAMAITNNAHAAGLFEQLGAPLLGWWPGEVGPSTVGVYSYFDGELNSARAAGGAPLFRLIQQARTEFP